MHNVLLVQFAVTGRAALPPLRVRVTRPGARVARAGVVIRVGAP
jgi:hypothetical protein